MGKYIDLTYFLMNSKQEQVNISFLEIERILGFKLPPSAYVHMPWWANGGHSQANAWLKAGYKVKKVCLLEKEVIFCKNDIVMKKDKLYTKKMFCASKTDTYGFVPEKNKIIVNGYEFCFLQTIKPLCDDDGKIVKFYPQDNYDNKNNLPLSAYGKGGFCRFSINAPKCAGVYIWVVEDKIIYIGETENLYQRFNVGYGNISPRNCYIKGQSTNCKMNKIVLELYEQGKMIDLYFYETKEYKAVELELLKRLNTLYNVKDNSQK